MISYDQLQEGIFLCNLKLHLSDWEVMSTKWHRMKKKIELFVKYQEEFSEAIKEGVSKLKFKK